jgi:hypothetical protein
MSKKRAPPPGGLNLKAMSVAWRKAGKPCDWKAWCASKRHHIYKDG